MSTNYWLSGELPGNYLFTTAKKKETEICWYAAMTSFVRDSKFRHVHSALPPREQFYEQLRVANNASDGNYLTSNSKFVAYVDSSAGGAVITIFSLRQVSTNYISFNSTGSAVAVLPLSSVGKNHIPILAPTYQQPLLRAHSAPVQDLSFTGFSNQVFCIYNSLHFQTDFYNDVRLYISTLSWTKSTPVPPMPLSSCGRSHLVEWSWITPLHCLSLPLPAVPRSEASRAILRPRVLWLCEVKTISHCSPLK